MIGASSTTSARGCRDTFEEGAAVEGLTAEGALRVGVGIIAGDFVVLPDIGHLSDRGGCGERCFHRRHTGEVGLDAANLSKEELALEIKRFVPELSIHTAAIGSDLDKRNYVVSNEKIKKKGFEAQHSLAEGIQQLITCFRMLPSGPFANV